VLEGENAIARYREVMGATDPNEAAEGTIRKQFALSKGENSTHGSDSPASADREIALNFRLDEIVG
jgi:nucleoside-diphosphate kinase